MGDDAKKGGGVGTVEEDPPTSPTMDGDNFSDLPVSLSFSSFIPLFKLVLNWP